MRRLVIAIVALVMLASFGLGFHLSEDGESRMNITNTTNETTNTIDRDNQTDRRTTTNRQRLNANLNLNYLNNLNDSVFEDYDIEYFGEKVNRSDLFDSNLTKWEIAEVFNLITIYDPIASKNKLITMVNESEIVELLNNPKSRKFTFGSLVNFDINERLEMFGLLNESDTNRSSSRMDSVGTRSIGIGDRGTTGIGIRSVNRTVNETNQTVQTTNQTGVQSSIQNATEPEGDTRTQTTRTQQIQNTDEDSGPLGIY